MSKSIELTGITVSATQLAMLFRDDDTGKEVWLPFSKIEDMDASPSSDKVTITVPEWLATEKGLL